MAPFRALLALLLFATSVLCDIVPQITTSYSNSSRATATLTTSASVSSPVCCWLAVHSVNVQVWYVSSVEVTASTILTRTYQYNDTKIVNSTTIAAEYTTPTGYFDPASVTTSLYGLDGVPTNIVQSDILYSKHLTTMVQGTAVTDPYGNVVQSPTPFFVFGSNDPVWYQTAAAKTSPSGDGQLVCLHSSDPFGENAIDSMMPYPSGFWLPLALENSTGYYGEESYQGNFRVGVPEQLIDYMQSNVRPGASSFWSSVSICSPGVMDGQPTAHIAVNQLTGSASTTILVNGNYHPATTAKTSEATQTLAKPSISPSPSEYVPTTRPPVQTPVPSNTVPQSPGGGPDPGNNESSSEDSETKTTVAGSPDDSTPTPDTITTVIVEIPSQIPVDTAIANPITYNPTPTPVPVPIFTVSDATYVGGPGATFVVGSSTLTPGGTVIAGSTTYFLPPTPTAVIINGITQAIQSTEVQLPPQQATGLVFTAGGETYTANSANEFVIGSSTLTPGGTIVADSTTYILSSTPTAVTINGVTQSIQYAGSSPVLQQATVPVFTAGENTYTANLATEFVIGTATLTPGGTILAGSTTYILSSTPTAVIVNGVPQIVGNIAIVPVSETHLATLVIGSSTYTANSESAFVVDGQTLTAGGIITNAGEIISLATGASEAVIVSGTSITTATLGAISTSDGGLSVSPLFSPAATASTSVGGTGPLLTSSGVRAHTGVWFMGIVIGFGIGAVLIL